MLALIVIGIALLGFFLWIFIENEVEKRYNKRKDELESKYNHLMNEANDYIHKQHSDLEKILSDKSEAFPHVAALASDYLTWDYYFVESLLGRGYKPERVRAAKIYEIHQATKTLLADYKIAAYQLDYLFRLFPDLEDYLSSDFREIKTKLQLYETPSDPYSVSISKDVSFSALSDNEKNQLALDRYISSHKKTSWQIGRDYELYVGYRMRTNHFKVNHTGISDKLEDLGRDIIATKNDIHYIVQCKYWSSDKVIREKHIAQLYGTGVCYALEHNLPLDKVRCVFYTNIDYSDMAKQFAEALSVKLIDHFELGEYPRIKCKVNYDEYGKTYIYHLPMDQQYDTTIINPDKGDMYAFTVEEAVSHGFRRAYRWHGN